MYKYIEKSVYNFIEMTSISSLNHVINENRIPNLYTRERLQWKTQHGAVRSGRGCVIVLLFYPSFFPVFGSEGGIFLIFYFTRFLLRALDAILKSRLDWLHLFCCCC